MVRQYWAQATSRAFLILRPLESAGVSFGVLYVSGWKLLLGSFGGIEAHFAININWLTHFIQK